MTDKPLILVADDETRIRRLVVESLENAGFDVCQAQDGRQAVDVFRLSPVEPDLVILDLMMPEMDGEEALKAIRKTSAVPVLILTARDFLCDKSKCFNAGADDYLVKPFSIQELELRVRALLRRTARQFMVPRGRTVVNGPLTLRSEEHDVLWRGTSVPVTDREFRLLESLASRPGAVVRYDELLRIGWGLDSDADISHLRVAVARIRKKLESISVNPAIISSFTNVGYMMGDLTSYDEDYGDLKRGCNLFEIILSGRQSSGNLRDLPCESTQTTHGESDHADLKTQTPPHGRGRRCGTYDIRLCKGGAPQV